MVESAGVAESQRRALLLLALVLAVALLHALTQARLRPLYQVSDEMAYLRAAQVLALADTPPDIHACIAPPDGRTFELGEGGKAGFRHTTASQLRWWCRHGGDALPLFALRAWNALSFPFVALAAWVLAWHLSRSQAAALAAATVVAVHPIAAKYAGAVTPDAWATAFSAWALVAFTRIIVGRHCWWDLPLLAACTVAGLLWKDTTNFLVPMTAIASLAFLWWLAQRRTTSLPASPAARLAAVVGAMLGVVATVALVTSTGCQLPWADLVTPYVANISDGTRAAATASPWTFLDAVLDDMLLQARGFVASSLLSLYRPLVYVGDDTWRQPLLTPWAVAVGLTVVYAVGAVGALRAMVQARDGMPRLPANVTLWWTLALLLCAAQPSVRNVLLLISDLHQGRWLFPVLAPAAAFVGIGLTSLLRRAAAVPPTVALGLGSLWVVVVDIVRHYYLRLPDIIATPALFTRPTGDADVGDREITALIVATTEAQDPVVTWGILVLLAVATLGLALAVARRNLPHSHV